MNAKSDKNTIQSRTKCTIFILKKQLKKQIAKHFYPKPKKEPKLFS